MYTLQYIQVSKLARAITRTKCALTTASMYGQTEKADEIEKELQELQAELDAFVTPH